MARLLVFLRMIQIPVLPLLSLLVASVTVVYFSFFGFSLSQKLKLFVHGGYYVAGLSLLLAVIFSIKPLAASLARIKWKRADAFSLLVLMAVLIAFFVPEKNEYKVVMDEVVLLATSKGLYENVEPEYPVFGYWYMGEFQPGLLEIDKRPILFPFLTAMLHSLRGYSVDNAFLLNTCLSVVLLILSYCMARKLAPPLPAFIGVLLFVSIPEFVITGNGAGFGVLNLLVIVWVLLAAVAYLEDSSTQTLNALIFSGVLLSLVRPESVLLIFAVCAVIIVGALKFKRLPLSYWASLAPILVAIYVFQNGIFKVRQALWQEMGPDGLLNLSYFWDNLKLNLMYFFDVGFYSSNSLALSVLGLLSLVGLFFLWRSRSFRLPRSPALIVLALFFGFVCFQFCLFQFYYGGDVYKWSRSRYTLPLYLILCLSVTFFLAQPLTRRRGILALFLITSSIEIFAFNLPAVFQQRRTVYAIHENLKQAFVREHADQKFLVIGGHETQTWTVNGQSAVPAVIAVNWLPQLKFLYDIGYFDATYFYHPPYRGEDPVRMKAIQKLESVLNIQPVTDRFNGEFTVISPVTAIQVDGVEDIPAERIRYDSPRIATDPVLGQRIKDSFPYWRIQ